MELSIVIPTLNRSASLKKTLQSITDQQLSNRQYEVIVVDNGSTDNTVEVCRFFEKHISNFVYCYDDEPGQLTGRHKGTELSKANIISFIDDDVEVNPYWINSIIQLFADDESVSIIGGPCLPKYQLYPPSWVSYFWQPTPYGGNMCLPLSLVDIGCNKLGIDPLYVFGLNYSIRKKSLLDLGGFHPDCIPEQLQKYQGDGETGLSIKAKNHNYKALYAASALLYHQVPPERLTTEYFEKWYFYNGVCQSFTDIRSENKLHSSNGEHEVTTGLITRVANRTGNILRKAIQKNLRKLPGNIIKLQSCFRSKYNEGYQFHQHNYRTDVSVRNWVLRKDYWNYKLPGVV